MAFTKNNILTFLVAAEIYKSRGDIAASFDQTISDPLTMI